MLTPYWQATLLESLERGLVDRLGQPTRPANWKSDQRRHTWWLGHLDESELIRSWGYKTFFNSTEPEMCPANKSLITKIANYFLINIAEHGTNVGTFIFISRANSYSAELRTRKILSPRSLSKWHQAWDSRVFKKNLTIISDEGSKAEVLNRMAQTTAAQAKLQLI